MTFARRLVPVSILVAATVGASGSSAQQIGIRSVPVAVGDQFRIQPSRNAALGDVGVALADPLLDPFINPAWGSRTSQARVWAAPMFYDVSGGDGSVRSLPIGGAFSAGAWFGAVSLALQQVIHSRPEVFAFLDAPSFESGAGRLSDRASNTYVTGILGRRLGSRISIGASISWADLGAVDGVDQMYAVTSEIRQAGHSLDVRAGLAGETEAGGEFQALVLHNRFDMTQDVQYPSWFFPIDPLPCNLPTCAPSLATESNRDVSNTWGVQLGYRRPIGQQGWMLGGMLTANRQVHPHIPNYQLANIPRDPGRSWAWNVGAGIARRTGTVIFGVDAIWEPIRSHTWAVSDVEFVTGDGRSFRPGDRTVDNEFVFSNAILRFGAGHESDRWEAGLGLELHSIDYTLEQRDIANDLFRRQPGSWLEWTPTLGAALRFPDLELRYSGRLTLGTGRPGVAWNGITVDALTNAPNFITPPSGPLTLQEATVMTHQLMISLPIR